METKRSLSFTSIVVTTFIFLFFIIFAATDRSSTNASSSSKKTAITIRLQSWNLRFDSQPNLESINDTISHLNSTIPFDDQVDYYSNYKEVPWSLRRIGIKNDVLFNQVDFFTINEGLVRQVHDLEELLDMSYIGVGREDGGGKGEFQAVYYNKDKFELLSNDTFWLSETPFTPSKYRDAGSFRSCTVGYFKDVESGVEFTLINVHLDDQSDTQRRLASALVRYRAAYEYEDKGCSVILLGDFNSESSGETSGAYQITTGGLDYGTDSLNEDFLKKYSNSLSNFTLDDLLLKTKVENRIGNLATFTGFNENSDKFTRIDFQFGGNPNNGDELQWEVLRYKVGESWYDNSYYLSDHRPVISDIVITN